MAKSTALPYVFDLADEARWPKHLADHGYVVLRGVADAEQVETAKALLWGGIAQRFGHVSREAPSTWGFPLNQGGIVPWLAQSEGAWAVRGWPGVKRAFARIWRTEDLIVSMDCVILWKPWWIEDKCSPGGRWTPCTEGLHLDQNPFSKPGLDCVQGMVPLLPVTDVSGGLQVVPDSHLEEAKETFKRTHAHMQSSGDWCPCDDDDLNQQAVLLLAEPGDLILWDSRTIHGGHVGTGNPLTDEPVELARMAVTVAMTPRERAGPLVQQRRQEGFRKGENFNHCPHEAGSSNGTIRAPVRRGFRPVTLSDEQRSLL